MLYTRYLLNSVLSGYCNGVSPVISFNYGKKDFQQVKVLFRGSLKASLIGSIVVLAASVFLRDAIVSLFASGNEPLSAMAERGILLFSISYLFNGVNIFATTLFTSLSNGRLSAVMASMNFFFGGRDAFTTENGARSRWCVVVYSSCRVYEPLLECLSLEKDAK